MPFDEKKLIDLVADESRLETEVRELAVQLEDQYQTDGWDGDKAAGKLIRYRKDQSKHEQLTRELTTVRQQRERMEDHRPDNRKLDNHAKDALRRWMLGGAQLLEAGERSTFLAEVTPDLIRNNPLLGLGGELFLVDGLNPMLAADDAYRSDINTGDSAGGLAAAETWRAGLVEKLKYFGSVSTVAQNFSTADGNDFHVNQMDSTGQTGGGITDQSQTSSGIPGTDPLANVTDIVLQVVLASLQLHAGETGSSCRISSLTRPGECSAVDAGAWLGAGTHGLPPAPERASRKAS